MVMPVPTFELAKVNTGDPTRDTSSPPRTPVKVENPEALAAVVPSYALFTPEIPVMVKGINTAVVTSIFIGDACKLGVASSSCATI